MKIKVGSNAGKLARTYQRRIRQIDVERRKGLRNAAIAVDNRQVHYLTGGEGPGAYPIRVLTGNLLGGHFFSVRSQQVAVVGNKTAYAIDVHEGRNRHEVHGPRRFLDDAVGDTDVLGITQTAVREAIFAL